MEPVGRSGPALPGGRRRRDSPYHRLRLAVKRSGTSISADRRMTSLLRTEGGAQLTPRSGVDLSATQIFPVRTL